MKYIIPIIIILLVTELPIYLIINNLLEFLFMILFLKFLNLGIKKFGNSDNLICFILLTTIRFIIFNIFFITIMKILTNEDKINSLFYILQNVISKNILENMYTNLNLIIIFLSLSVSYGVSKITKFIFKFFIKNKNNIDLKIIDHNSNKFDWILFIFAFILTIFFIPESVKEKQGDFINIMTSFTLIDLLISKLKNK